VKQGALVALLYLENHLAPHVFTPARLAVLQVLASEAAMALENSRLYRELQEREAQIRRLIDANIIGITLWDFDGRILEANDAFLALVGYSREELASGRMPWPKLTPAEWRAVDQRRFAELRATGRSAPVEKEYVRKDGSRVPVLVGSATFEGQRDAGVSFVLDLTERKRAEEALHQAQMELAHVARVVTLGELTASIAHEINQPLTAVVTNGAACLRWLQRDRPDLDEACAAVQRVVAEGRRASDVLRRIRGLLQRAPAVLTPLPLQETIEEVLLLVRAEARRQQITLGTVFGDDVPPVLGDRVQIQQVLLNLVRNSMEAMSAVVDRPRELHVQTQRQAVGGVLVSVQDSGIGLRAEEVEKMFEPFFSTKPGGMGMGLRISRAIVEAHGGQLWAIPNDEHGATFLFTLPTSAEERG
jgi:PAS domain S-box-containing protein